MTDETATLARHPTPETPSTLLAKQQATNMLRLIGQVSALRAEIDALKASVVRHDLQCEVRRKAPQSGPSAASITMDNALLRHLAGQLDAHAGFGNALKARLDWAIDLCKATHACTRDVLQPFNRSVDNRLRFLEMVVEETILGSSPELQAKLARIRQMIGTADLSQREMSPPPAKNDASS